MFAAGGTSGVYGLVFLPECDHWLLLALINSSILDFYLKHVSTVYSGHAYSYGDQFIKRLPIRLPRNKGEHRLGARLVELARALTQTKGELRAKECERDTFPEPQLEKIRGRFELYPLTRLVQGIPQARQIDVDRVEIQQRPDDSWEMGFGRTRLIFPSEAHVRVAEAWLRIQGQRRVPVEKLLDLKLPAEEHICARLLDLLEETEQEISCLKSEIEEGEAALDELVAELYKLDKNDRKVIRGFLRKF